MSVRHWLTRLGDAVDETLALRVTLLLMLVRPPDDGLLRGATWAVAAAALAVPALVHASAIWLGLAVLMGARLALEFPLADNHLYLLAYWCLAIALAQFTADRRDTLARSARWLVGCTFACAVAWKLVLAPDFVDARFFRVTLLTDDRFADAVTLLGDITAPQIREARRFLQPLPEGAELADVDWFGEPPRLRLLAAVVTWGGIVVEGLVAVLWLLPLAGRTAVARHAALMLFCVTTYALAPVAGFGCLLAAMGLAQCRAPGRLATGYVVVFVLVLLYAEIPWASVLAG